MLKSEEELLKKLSIADLERANAYAKDLGMGLQIVRTFPQGVTVFGSARLSQDNKYCQMAYQLGGVPQRLEIPFDSAISLLGVFPKKAKH